MSDPITPTPEPTPEPTPAPETPPALTQAEVDRLVGKARTEARERVLKSLGYDDEAAAKTALEEATALKQQQMTETEKATAAAQKAQDEAEALRKQIADRDRSDKVHAALRAKGYPEDKLALAAKLVDGDTDEAIAESVEAVVTAFPVTPAGPVGGPAGGTPPPGGRDFDTEIAEARSRGDFARAIELQNERTLGT